MKDLFFEFYEGIRKEYSISLSYEFDIQDDFYYIWHDDEKLALNDEFMQFLGDKMYEFFSKNDIYNIGFGFDPEKAIIPVDYSSKSMASSIQIEKFEHLRKDLASSSEYKINSNLNVFYRNKKLDMQSFNFKNKYSNYKKLEGVPAA